MKDYNLDLVGEKVTLGDLKRLPPLEQAILLKCLSIRGPAGVEIRKIYHLAKIGEIGLLANVVDSKFDRENHRVTLITDMITEDDGQKIVIDMYLADMFRTGKERRKERWFHARGNINVNHVPIRTHIRTIH